MGNNIFEGKESEEKGREGTGGEGRRNGEKEERRQKTETERIE